MVATVKIIPFAVRRAMRDQGRWRSIGDDPLVRGRDLQVPQRPGSSSRSLPQTKPSIIAKSEAAIRDAHRSARRQLGEVIVVDHAIEPVSASAISARSTPAAISDPRLRRLGHRRSRRCHSGGACRRGRRGHPSRHAGRSRQSPDVRSARRRAGDRRSLLRALAQGQWLRLGAAAGHGRDCRHSPMTSWIWGQADSSRKYRRRPLPREALKAQHAPHIAAIVLAAGRSTAHGANKLLADLGGKPLVRHAVEAASSHRAPVQSIVVTGHERRRCRAALAGLDVTFVDNPLYADGPVDLAQGAASPRFPSDADGAIIASGRHAARPGRRSRPADRRLQSGRAPHASSCRSMAASAAIRSCGDANSSTRSQGITGDRGAQRPAWIVDAEKVTEIPSRIPMRVLADVDTPRCADAAQMKLLALEAAVAVAADDDVVVHRDAELFAGLGDASRHVDIGHRRRGIAGGMVVHQDDRRWPTSSSARLTISRG